MQKLVQNSNLAVAYLLEWPNSQKFTLPSPQHASNLQIEVESILFVSVIGHTKALFMRISVSLKAKILRSQKHASEIERLKKQKKRRKKKEIAICSL